MILQEVHLLSFKVMPALGQCWLASCSRTNLVTSVGLSQRP